jgi:threonine/homoserine/homoserine lactone efflux protein
VIGTHDLYIVGRSTQGFRAGAVAALGISAGIMVHVSAAALGISALLAASAVAFEVLKLAGAAYLVYIGISLIRSRGATHAAAPVQAAALRTIFVQGFWTNVLNPKVALFFLAFLPQFVDAGAESPVLPFLRVGRTLGASVWFNRSVGALFVCLGARLALAEK